MKLPIAYLAKFYIPLAFVFTVGVGLVYVAVQQQYRSNANDPQIQIAEDFANQLATGRTVSAINDSLSVDMAKSLAPFLLIYDDTGKVITGSGKLDGQFPTLPQGVLDYTKKVGQDRITWEPRSGVRSALVVMRYEGPTPGFVAVGRSLREVEQREFMLSMEALAAWLIGLVGLFVISIAGKIILSRNNIS